MKRENSAKQTSKICRPELVSGPQKAFTLAEVLITLAIIGVVAALTIPTVVRNYTEKQTVVQVKKVYSQLNQAFQMAVVNNGMPNTWGWNLARDKGDGVAMSYIVNKNFAPYLKILKNCGTGEGCYTSSTIKAINGKIPFSNVDALTDRAKIILADGAALSFYNFSGVCNSNQSILNAKPLNKACGLIMADINGAKAPNTVGRDIFYFQITYYGIVPDGMPDSKSRGNLSTGCTRKGTSVESSKGCTFWILKNENMDYLKKDITCTGSNTVGWSCSIK